MKPGTIRPGGRTARTREAVLNATLDELIAQGYAHFSMETVARRAGVHRTTIYRRWRSKENLLAEALESAAHRRIEVPNTGDIGEDLRLLARAITATLSSLEGAATLRALVSSAQDSEELRQLLRRFWATRMTQVTPIIERAVARGELPRRTDAAAVINCVAAPLYHRLLVTTEPLTDAVADRAAAAALAAARAEVFTSVPPATGQR